MLQAQILGLLTSILYVATILAHAGCLREARRAKEVFRTHPAVDRVLDALRWRDALVQ